MSTNKNQFHYFSLKTLHQFKSFSFQTFINNNTSSWNNNLWHNNKLINIQQFYYQEHPKINTQINI